MSDVGRWLAGARAAEGGLLLPGVPGSRACDLVLTPEAARVRADDVVAELSWDDVADRPDAVAVEGGAPDQAKGDGWRPGPWTQQNRPGGAALWVSGACAEATEEVRAERRSLWSRFERLFESGEAVCLYDQQYVGWQQGLDVDTIRILCSLLRDRTDWRSRLDDPVRVRRLAADLSARQHLVVTRQSVRRSTLLTLNALRALGHEHGFGGRPLPGWVPPDLEGLVDDVLDHVHGDPYAVGAHVDRDGVRKVVARYYTDVEPWPFAALAD